MSTATPPPTENSGSSASRPLTEARTRLKQIIETTGVGTTIRVQKDHIIALLDALDANRKRDEETLARALYAEYRERIPGALTWDNDSKADEFRAQAGRLLPHLRSEAPNILHDSRAGLISALEGLAVDHNLFDVLVAEEIADCALAYLSDHQSEVQVTGAGEKR